MFRFPRRLVLTAAVCALLISVGLAAWVLAAGPSEAQTGSMHNCPPAGRWSIAVWDGADGTAADDALATCGAGTVDAAYALDSQTGGWWRWFAGKPDVSNLPPLDDMTGLLALGSATGPAATPTATATATETATATPSPLYDGRTRENAVRFGHMLEVPPGWEIKVLDVDWDAWPEVHEENMFNDPPETGYKMIMVKLSAKNVQSGSETDLVSEGDFAFVGSQNVVREPFDPSCGVIPDDLWAELFHGGKTEGNVCFQAPTSETGLMMIAQFSWSDEDRRYFALQ